MHIVKAGQRLPYGSRSFPADWTKDQIEQWADAFEDAIINYRRFAHYLRGGEAVNLMHQGPTNDIQLTPSDWNCSFYLICKRCCQEERLWNVCFLHYLMGLKARHTAERLGVSRRTCREDLSYLKVIIGKAVSDAELIPAENWFKANGNHLEKNIVNI